MAAVATDAQSPEYLATEAITRWQTGEPADVQQLLLQHPQLRRYKSLVLDLALEEFCQRRAGGEELDLDVFSRRFPTYQSSLRRLLEVQSYLDKHPSLLPEEPIAWPEPGSDFLGFPLREELGRGAFARVYLATEPRLANRLVALKVSAGGMQEAERLAKLRHPNIVPVYRVEQDLQTQLTAVCMPYLGRATLCDVLDLAFGGVEPPTKADMILAAARMGADSAGAQTEEPDMRLRGATYIDGVLHLGEQLAIALDYTHRAGIYHLDLKPSNVLLTPVGRPMLLDFNLSVDHEATTTRIGGTLPYMSPEQIRASLLGDSQAEVDQRSDVFSLGVILYELLGDGLPFGALPWQPMLHGLGEHLLERQSRGPRPLSVRNPQVDPRLARVIERCLSFEAHQRPQTAAELASQLHAQLGLLSRSRRWLRRHRTLVYTGVLLAAGLAGAAAGHSYTRDPYWVRMYRQGLAYSERADYPNAIDCFTSSLAAHPNQLDVLIARARARECQNEFLPALEDYRNAYGIEPSPDLAARCAYCLSERGLHSEAIPLYEVAAAGGIESAEPLHEPGGLPRLL